MIEIHGKPWGVYEIEPHPPRLPPQISKKQKDGYTPMKSRKTGKNGVKTVKTGYTLSVERKNGIL